MRAHHIDMLQHLPSHRDFALWQKGLWSIGYIGLDFDPSTTTSMTCSATMCHLYIYVTWSRSLYICDVNTSYLPPFGVPPFTFGKLASHDVGAAAYFLLPRHCTGGDQARCITQSGDDAELGTIQIAISACCLDSQWIIGSTVLPPFYFEKRPNVPLT
jgi:hypothetical protein